ncbi:hypothetical protein [Chryseobacterium populi]|uniref:Uncharacterized protein n=1 Tax=Chryseobacterium populi TaxID=1144316 RepID=J3CMT2_9FLAO|nr:hypothetical protein [Chryseobacterium populi]EJL74844.1 hypothetical protein PMI13_00723 [Chryseobacterium populi]
MKIAYPDKRPFVNLILGILWIIIGASYFLENGNTSQWGPSITIAVGIFYILYFAYEYFSKYMEISKDRIKVNSIPKKEVRISDLTEVSRISDDYIFRSSDKILIIAKSQINKKDLLKFESFFNTLDIQLRENKQ